MLAGPRQRFDGGVQRLAGALGLATSKKRARFEAQAGRHRPEVLAGLFRRRQDQVAATGREMEARLIRRLDRAGAGLDKWASRLGPALARLVGDAGRDIAKGRERLERLDLRLEAAPGKRLADLSARLDALDRTRATLGYAETLKRGYAVIWGDGAVVTSKAAAEKAAALEVQFHDGRLALGARPARKPREGGGEQGSLF